jgi:hypothetical protein
MFMKQALGGIGLWCFAIAVICEGLGYIYGQQNDKLSETVIRSLSATAGQAATDSQSALRDSGTAVKQAGTAKLDAAAANGTADKAKNTAGRADIIAGSALREADSFEQGIASAKRDAAEANANLASANARAKDADAKAEGFRLSIAKANADAASANETAEREKLARVQLEARLADRTLTLEGLNTLYALAKSMPNERLDICTLGNNIEETQIARLIGGPLKVAGWKVRIWQIANGASGRGILMGTSATASANDLEAESKLLNFLNTHGVPTIEHRYDELLAAANSGIRGGVGEAVDAPILMMIGNKQ